MGAPDRGPAAAAGGATLGGMTAKEKLHEKVETLSEQEAERMLAALEGETVDEWGSLSKLHEVAFGETMRRLAERERAAGHKPW